MQEGGPEVFKGSQDVDAVIAAVRHRRRGQADVLRAETDHPPEGGGCGREGAGTARFQALLCDRLVSKWGRHLHDFEISGARRHSDHDALYPFGGCGRDGGAPARLAGGPGGVVEGICKGNRFSWAKENKILCLG